MEVIMTDQGFPIWQWLYKRDGAIKLTVHSYPSEKVLRNSLYGDDVILGKVERTKKHVNVFCYDHE